MGADHRSHCLRLFLGLALVYAMFLGPLVGPAELNGLHLAVSLVDRSSTEIPDYTGVDVARWDGRNRSGLPPGSALLAAAVLALGRPLFPEPMNHWGLLLLNTLCIALWSAPLAALAQLMLFRLVRSLPVRGAAAALTFLFASFGTAAFGNAGTFVKRGTAGCLLVVIVYLLWTWRGGTAGRGSQSSRARLLLAGLLTGSCVALEYATAIFAPFFLLYLVRGHPGPGRLLAFLAGGALPAAALLGYHEAAFGSPFATGYDFRLHGDGPSLAGFSLARLGRILAGARCGLFVYAPALALCVIGLGVAWRERIRREEMCLLVAGPAIASLLFYACLDSGDLCGGNALTPHRLGALFPLIAIPVALGVGRLPAGLTRALIAASIVFAYLAAQSFWLPPEVHPLGQSLEDAALSLGGGELFSRYLPRVLGVATPLSGAGLGGFELAGSAPIASWLTQLAFSLVQLTALWLVWRVLLRPGVAGIDRERQSPAACV